MAAHNTRLFTVQDNWDISYSFDCSQPGSTVATGTLLVGVYNSSGLPLDMQAIEVIGAKDEGVKHIAEGSTFFLNILSQCDYDVVVRGKGLVVGPPAPWNDP